MSTANEDRIIEGNKLYAKTYNGSGLELPPSKKLTILTCMDARLDPLAAYGLNLGEGNVIRNAGASAKDALRSIIVSNHVLGTEEVVIIKHTKCGLFGVTNEIGRHIIKESMGVSQSDFIDNYDFMPISDLEQSAKEEVEFLRNHETYVKKTKITGWIHDTDTGLIKKVVE